MRDFVTKTDNDFENLKHSGALLIGIIATLFLALPMLICLATGFGVCWTHEKLYPRRRRCSNLH